MAGATGGSDTADMGDLLERRLRRPLVLAGCLSALVGVGPPAAKAATGSAGSTWDATFAAQAADFQPLVPLGRLEASSRGRGSRRYAGELGGERETVSRSRATALSGSAKSSATGARVTDPSAPRGVRRGRTAVESNRPATRAPSARITPFPRDVPEETKTWSRAVTAGLALLALVLGLRSYISDLRARRLEEQRNLLVDDVAVLQRVLVRDVPQRIGDLCVAAAYSPAEGPGAGGDFYDAFPLRDGRAGLILGDVAGHGRCALERAAVVRYTVRAYVEAGLEPREALKLTNSVLGDDPDARFVTVAVAVFDTPAGLVTYSLAGHHPPLLLAGGIREPLDVCSSPPLGLGLPTGLRQTTVSLSQGGIACFFTDGVVEARVGGRMFGRDNLERLLVTLGPEPDPSAVLDQATGAASDDRAVCIARMVTGDRRAPLQVEELELEESDLQTSAPKQFLSSLGLATEEIAAAVETARIAAERGPALLRVRLGESGASVEVKRALRRSLGASHTGAGVNRRTHVS